MLGIGQPLDGPVFEKLEHAEDWCWEAMVDRCDRRLGMSDAVIHPFRGMLEDHEAIASSSSEYKYGHLAV